jgi:hypothetical protein
VAQPPRLRLLLRGVVPGLDRGDGDGRAGGLVLGRGRDRERRRDRDGRDERRRSTAANEREREPVVDRDDRQRDQPWATQRCEVRCRRVEMGQEQGAPRPAWLELRAQEIEPCPCHRRHEHRGGHRQPRTEQLRAPRLPEPDQVEESSEQRDRHERDRQHGRVPDHHRDRRVAPLSGGDPERQRRYEE